MDLTQVILQGDTAFLQHLLNTIDDVNYLDEYGYSPLIQCVIADKLDVAKLLLEKGADPNQKDVTGRSPLHWAVYNNSLAFCELLLEYHADPNAYTISSEPVLSKPVLRNHFAIKKALMTHGADLQFAHDYINAKLLGHRFELIGSVDIVDTHGVFTEVDYEGFYLDSSIDLIQNSLREFRYNFAARAIESWFPTLDHIIACLGHSQLLLKHDHYLAAYQNKHTACQEFLKQLNFILPINQQGHAFSVVKYGPLLAIIDRATDSPPQDRIPIYYINRPIKITADFIYALVFEHETIQNIHHNLKTTLSLQELDSLPIPDQRIGSCSWANIEAIVPVMKFMMSFDNTKNETVKIDLREDCLELFRRWQKWDRERVLNQVVTDFKKASIQRKAAIAALLTGIVFQCCDVDNETEYALALHMLPIITKKEYGYIIDSYKKFYVFENSTRAGANFISLLERYEREVF